MKTRSQSQSQRITFDLVIDFDEASREWNANKRRLGNGEYEYICGKVLRNGHKCQHPESSSHRCSASFSNR